MKINKLRFKVTQGSDTSGRDSEYWLQIWFGLVRAKLSSLETSDSCLLHDCR